MSSVEKSTKRVVRRPARKTTSVKSDVETPVEETTAAAPAPVAAAQVPAPTPSTSAAAKPKKTVVRKRKVEETRREEEPREEEPRREEDNNENQEEDRPAKKVRRRRENTDVAEAADDLRDLAENREEMTLEERYDAMINCSNVLTEGLTTLNRELRGFGRLLKRHEKESRTRLTHALNNSRRRRRDNTERKHTSSGFVCPVPLPDSLRPFVDMGRDPTPADNLEPKKKNPRENWWEHHRWINAKNSTCWRLESNDENAARWVKCDRMEIARPQVTSVICQYVSSHGLKDENNGSVFYPDESLRGLLGDARYPMNSKEENSQMGFGISNLASYVGDIFRA